MPTRNELKELAKLRLEEAEPLFIAGLYDGAVYICGYVIEFALKARICKLLDTKEYPSSGKLKSAYAVHNLDQLIFLSGLENKLDPTNVELHRNWSLTTPWSPEMRYQPRGTISKNQAEEILNAVREKPNGVLKWIMKYW
jgi:HEPN domain-containing protein